MTVGLSTIGWQAWPLPERILFVEGFAAAVLVGLFWRWRQRLSIALVHLWLSERLVAGLPRLPRGALEWGLLLVAAGFILLFAGVWINFRMTRRGLSLPKIPSGHDKADIDR